MFKPDQPIETKRDDVLGTGPFAVALGDAILGYEGKDSLVVGLYGPWGSGKTSILNMALEHMEAVSRQSEDKTVIMRFNPWNYSDQQRLLSQFFRELSTTLARGQWGNVLKKAGKWLVKYSWCLRPLQGIPKVGILARATMWVTARLGKCEDLESIKKKLSELLGRQKRKILVVIDDIDRLNRVEIRQIFQLLKCLGDFPNTLYLLAFDRAIVVEALGEIQAGAAEDYLEKMIQVPFEVPVVSKRKVAEMLQKEINHVVGDVPEDTWDERYMVNVWHSGVTDCFNTVRDVRRFSNSLRFAFGLLRGEVNPVDLIAITAIKVFEPGVYEGIKNNKELFTDSGLTERDNWNQQAKERCDEIIERRRSLEGERLKELLRRVFPPLDGVYGNVHHGGSDWRKQRRICSRDVFDIYFRLCVPEGEIPQTEVNRILSLAVDEKALEEALKGLNKDGRVVRFLERLQDYGETGIGVDKIRNIVAVLVNIGDLFPEVETGFYQMDGTGTKVIRACYWFVKSIVDRETRFAVLENALENAKESIFTVVDLVVWLGWEHGKHTRSGPEPEEKRIVDEAQLGELEAIACKKIEQLADAGRLAKSPHLQRILYTWMDWATQERVREFVDSVVENDDGLLDVLSAFVGKLHSQGMGEYGYRTEYRINMEELAKFLDVAQAESRIRAIGGSKVCEQLDNRKRRAVQVFLDTLDGKIKDRF